MMEPRRWLYACVVSCAFIACQGQQEWHDVQETRFLLGTIVSFKLYTNDDKAALAAIQQAVMRMREVERTFTTFGKVENSVQRFNRAPAGEEVYLDVAVNTLLEQGMVMHEQTRGAFDPALGALNQAWAFSKPTSEQQPLAPHRVAKILKLSGVQHIRQNNTGAWLKEYGQTQLDFGAIAKGLALDRACESLSQQGIEHAIVNAGGDMRIIGDHGGQAWKVAVRHPRQNEPLGWFEVGGDVSIVTSGDYERFFMFENKRYHHIIDPQTGYPANNNMSVTVLAKQATQADALSTAMFILEAETGLELIENMPDVEALWVDKNKQLHMSSGMKALFHRQLSH